MEKVIELSDVVISRENMNNYKIFLKHNSDKNTHTVYSYLLERLNIDQERDSVYNPEQSYSININTYSVTSFDKFLENNNYRLEYDIVLKILQEYSNIIMYLEKMKKTIVLFSLEDLVVIDETMFLFINNENIFNLRESNEKMVDISIPLEMTKFISPELQKQESLPFSLDYRSGFFSLASILTYCLFAETLIDKDQNQVEKLLQPINNTKLFWFIIRCGERNIKERVCLFV